jgi:lipopolysaccharide export system protein LptA
MKKQRKIQIALVSIGLILFFLTYLYNPNLSGDKVLKDKKDAEKVINEKQSTAFENIEYKGLYDFNKPFVVQSDKAYILNEKPNIVFMSNMHVVLYLNDGRIVNIVSDKGRYNKVTYDCFFEQNVKATDGSTKIFAENLDLLATENFVEIYNNVNLDYPAGHLQADKIDYNFETKYFKVSMFDDKLIKMKIIQ